MAQVGVRPSIHRAEYDAVQDTLFIEFEPITVETSYEDVDGARFVMRRFTVDDDRLVGISVYLASLVFGTEEPGPAAIRQLAEELVARYARAGTSPP